MSLSETRAAVAAAKSQIRQRVWGLLDAQDAVQPPGAAGHIPAFVGAEAAAERLAQLYVWQAAQVIKANPDRAQLPVRVAALEDGKLVYMAVPRLASPEPFYRLDPARLGRPYQEAASGQGAAAAAPRVSLEQMQPVDLIVCGTVAVDRRGVRIGKGAGYSDIEVGLLYDAGLIGSETVIVTTVHDLQVVDEELPVEAHDFRVQFIVTPTRVIECPRVTVASGIDQGRLTGEQVRAIPVLRQLPTTGEPTLSD